MTVELDAKQQEVDKNFAAFLPQLQELLRTHAGKFALMRNREIVEYFDTARDARMIGEERYSDGLFSVQEVTDEVVDLGFFSHAVHNDPV